MPGERGYAVGLMRRRHIVPGSLRIFGFPNTDRNSGFATMVLARWMWSETSYVGSINYLTGDVVMAQKYFVMA